MSRSRCSGTLHRTNILSSLFLLALSGLLCSTPALAGRKPPPPPPPPPPGPVVLNDILASFVGTHINLGPPGQNLLCTPQGEATTAGGTLACEPGASVITINTYGIGSLSTGKRTAGICQSFSVINGIGFSGSPSNSTVAYTGDCNSAQGCTIQIAMTLTGNVDALTGGVADHATIAFAGLVTNAGSSNPFADARSISLDQFVLNFLKPTGASAASCFWGVSTPEAFVSQPVPPL